MKLFSPAQSLCGGTALALLFLCASQASPHVNEAAKAAAGAETPRPLNRADFLAIAARVMAANSELSRVWPGYWPADQSFIIYSSAHGALLISSAAPPPSFQPLVAPDVPARLKGRVYWHSGSLPEVRRPFVTGYSLGAGRTAILVNAETASSDEVITLLLHEEFHDYQKRAFKGGAASQFVDPLAIKDRVAFTALAETERRVLAKAVRSGNRKERNRLLQQYLALRQEREARMPPETIKVERGFERTEGTAKYVDRVGQARILGQPGRLKSLLAAELHKPLTSEGGAFVTQWFRSRSYGTGAAITYLLSELDRESWRAKLEGGAAPDELLRSLIGKLAPGNAKALAKATRASFGHDAILHELGPKIRAGEKSEIKSVDEFLLGARHLLVLDAKAISSGTVGFDANNMAQLGPGTMALPMATMFNYSAPAVSLSARSIPVLVDGRRYTLLLSSPPDAVGLPASASGETRLDSLQIESGAFQLRIDRPVVVTVSERATIIRIVGR